MTLHHGKVGKISTPEQARRALCSQEPLISEELQKRFHVLATIPARPNVRELERELRTAFRVALFCATVSAFVAGCVVGFSVSPYVTSVLEHGWP